MSKLSSSNPFDDEDDTPWAASSTAPAVDDGALVRDALKKEKMITDIQNLQEGLKALVARINTTQTETDKLATENVVLDQYIANLSKK